MGSETESRIPLVDLSSQDLKPGSSSWLKACHDIRRALEEYGCFEVIYSQPSIEFHNRILEVLQEFFQLPQETKMKNVNSKHGLGYEIYPTILLRETQGIEHANNKEECQKFTDLMWPDGNHHFCETLHSCTKMLEELQQLLVKMLYESYGIPEKNSESHVKSMTYLLRLLKYRRLQGETKLGLKGHTDKTFLSILQQNHINGLQLRKDTGEWVCYEPSSNSSFTVIAGDVCMAWSNDRIKSCYHGVNFDGEEARYAVGLFSFLTGLIAAPEELIDDEHPLQYKPFENGPFIEFFLSSTDENKGESNMVKAYCGV